MNPQVPADGLVLGTLALQFELINRAQLADALQEWFANPARSVDQLLVERGYLTASDRQNLLSLTEQHLARPLQTVSSSLRFGHEPALQTVRESSSKELETPTRSLSQTIAERGTFDGNRSGEAVLTELNASDHRFRLLRPHAVGGLGMVSVAHDAELDREVAIKEMRYDSLSDDAIGRFMTEARVTGQLDHPGIPPVYALGYFEDGRPFYAMRLIDGVTLKEAVADFHKRFPPPDQSRERSLELRKLLGAFVSVCHTLRYAHSRNVLHRDIKPSNIMLGGFGETLVLDWGLAKSKEQSTPYSALEAKAYQSHRRGDDPTLTGTGSVMGTPHYMSPEQAHGQWESVNLRSEVYSLGATLYTLLTGKLPFGGTTREAVLEQVRRGEFDPPRSVDSRIPAELNAICTKAMALEREDRFANAGELATEIEHWLADEPIRSYQEPVGRRWQRWLKSHRTAVAALIALLVTSVIGLSVAVFFISSEQRRANREEARAIALAEIAEEQARALREFVAKFLVLTYNNELARVPGSERARLQLLDDAIEKISSWALAAPHDKNRRFDLSTALRERSSLLAATGQPDLAWSDMVRSIAYLDEMGAASGTPQSTAIRLTTMSQWADLVADRYGPAAAVSFLDDHQQAAVKLFQHDASSLRTRITLAVLNIRYARELAKLGRLAEATETIDSAASLCELLRGEFAAGADLSRKFENDLIDAPFTTLHFTYVARAVQALIAAQAGDLTFASECAERAEEVCELVLEQAPDAMEPLAIKLEMLALETRLSSELGSPNQSLDKARSAMREAAAISNRFPRQSHLAFACGQIALGHAELELAQGTLTGAALSASRAVKLLTLHSEQLGDQRNPLALAKAHRLSGEIAWLEGDSAAAQAHCHAARQALINAAHEIPAAGQLVSEAPIDEALRIDALERLAD